MTNKNETNDYGVRADAPERDFAIYLHKACEGNSNVPAPRRGRDSWFTDQLAQLGSKITVQAVNRWFQGISKPGDANLHALETVLGITFPPEVTAGRARTYNRKVAAPAKAPISQVTAQPTAAVSTLKPEIHVVLARAILDDAKIQLVEGNDEYGADLYLTIRGTTYPVAVVLGEAGADGWEFKVSAKSAEAIVVGVLSMGGSRYRMLNLTSFVEDAPEDQDPISITVKPAEDEGLDIDNFKRRL